MHDWLMPNWPAPASVRAICTTRSGGASRPPFDALNLALHVGDHLKAVRTNRDRLQSAIDTRPVFLQQVHGTAHVAIDSASLDGVQADACSTADIGVACTIMVADCLPVLLCDAQGQRIAAAHAGWRGLAGGVLRSAVDAFDPLGAASEDSAADLLAWLGPCIGPQAFEVGAEVRKAFIAQLPAAAALFVPCASDKWLADLAGLARLHLRALGVERIYGNDGNDAWCTVRSASRFFSHRRDGVGWGGTGRFAACIWRTG